MFNSFGDSIPGAGMAQRRQFHSATTIAGAPACRLAGESRQRLTCCWQPNTETSLLECHWEISPHSAAGSLEQRFAADTERTPSLTLRGGLKELSPAWSAVGQWEPSQERLR